MEVVPVFLEILTTHTAAIPTAPYFLFWQKVKERLDFGMRKYGRPLTTHNGRDSLKDAWEEACDGAQYLVQAYCEGRLKNPQLMHDQIKLLLEIEEELNGATQTDQRGETEGDEVCYPRGIHDGQGTVGVGERVVPDAQHQL